MAFTTSKIKTTQRSKILVPARLAKLGATAGWTAPETGVDSSVVQCPASQTAATLVLPINGLAVGDTITGLCMKGGTAGAAAKTLAWSLYKVTGASGTITPALIQALTSDATGTAHAVSTETLLTTPYKIATNEQYYVLFTTTTAAGVTFDLTGVEVYVKKTFGQES